MDFTKLVGLSVVDFVQRSDGAYAFLFDDGIILTVSPDAEAGWVQGTGWEEVWRSLKNEKLTFGTLSKGVAPGAVLESKVMDTFKRLIR